MTGDSTQEVQAEAGLILVLGTRGTVTWTGRRGCPGMEVLVLTGGGGAGRKACQHPHTDPMNPRIPVSLRNPRQSAGKPACVERRSCAAR